MDSQKERWLTKDDVFTCFFNAKIIFQQRWTLKAENSLHKKMKFSITDFYSKCDQIRRKLRICSHLLMKSLMENFIFCAAAYASHLRIEQLNALRERVTTITKTNNYKKTHMFRRFGPPSTHACTHTRTHARTHTHAHTHARTHIHLL